MLQKHNPDLSLTFSNGKHGQRGDEVGEGGKSHVSRSRVRLSPNFFGQKYELYKFDAMFASPQ